MRDRKSRFNLQIATGPLEVMENLASKIDEVVEDVLKEESLEEVDLDVVRQEAVQELQSQEVRIEP